jgi:hypothetical protein
MASLALQKDAEAARHLAVGTGYLREIDQLEELAQGIGLQALAAYRQGDLDKAKQYILSALSIATELRGLLATPDYPLAVWALMLAGRGKNEEANAVYQLVLSEPLGAASPWFAEQFGRFIPHTPPASLMPPEERWTAITQLYQTLS